MLITGACMVVTDLTSANPSSLCSGARSRHPTDPGRARALGVPGQHEPRDPHPAQLHHRHDRHRPYALGLLDLEMPETNGIELARQIRRLPEVANTPLMILSSGGKLPEFAALSAELDLRAFLLKPVKQSDSFNYIIQTLSRSKVGALARPQIAQEPFPPLEPITGPQGNQLRVLLAEDNAANREVALWQLHKRGCLADAVVNGREVLEALGKASYDVILMDCQMPKMDGYAAACQIRQHEGSARHTRIIRDERSRADRGEKCLADGIDDYISKPVTLESLAAALRRVLGMETGVAPTAPDAPAEPPDGAPAPALDPATMASPRAKRDLLPGLIDTVLTEIPEQLQQIADAPAGRNCTDAAIAAHCLKGTAKIFSAARMAELAAAVEQAADAEVMEKAATELEKPQGRMRARLP